MEGMRPFWSQEVIKRVCEIHGITKEDFLSPQRHSRFARPRFAAVYVMRYFGMSYPRCARMVGRTDHSTAIHAKRMAEVYCQYEHGFAEIIEELIDAACPGASASVVLPRPIERTAA